MHTLAGPALLNSQYLLDTFGLAGLVAIVFAECGLLIGFFLPGDSLLFTAGLLVANRVFHVPLWSLLVLVPLAAIAGNLVGYWIGYQAGPAVFRRPNSRLFRQEYVDRTAEFFQRYGPRAIVLARFVPVVRTFTTVMAGAGRMRFASYAVYSVVGGLLWGLGVTLLGYFLGHISVIRNHVELILIGIVVLSVVPIVFELVRHRRRRGGGTSDGAEAAAATAAAPAPPRHRAEP